MRCRGAARHGVCGLLLVVYATIGMANNETPPLPTMPAPTPHAVAQPDPLEFSLEFSPEGGFEDLSAYTDELNAAHMAAAEAEPAWLSGLASWYSDKFHGRRTASGEPYLRHGFTIAHRQWPLGTKVSIRNPANGIKVIATVNDRGPFHPNRLIDVSFAIAKTLGIVQQGVAPVEVRLLSDSDVSLHLHDSPAAAPTSRQGVRPPAQWPLKLR